MFEDREGKTWSDIDLWSTLKSTVATVEGRVASVTRKIEQIEREKMERAAQELDAGGGEFFYFPFLLLSSGECRS